MRIWAFKQLIQPQLSLFKRNSLWMLGPIDYKKTISSPISSIEWLAIRLPFSWRWTSIPWHSSCRTERQQCERFRLSCNRWWKRSLRLPFHETDKLSFLRANFQFEFFLKYTFATRLIGWNEKIVSALLFFNALKLSSLKALQPHLQHGLSQESHFFNCVKQNRLASCKLE